MRRGLILIALALAFATGGCAYYNLFYNAQKAFGEAEDLGKDIDLRNQPTGNQKSKYRICIDKCQLVLEEYPDSDYVDDALFLMGKSYYRLKEARNYRSAIQNFDLVLANFPTSEFAAEALYLKSLSHLALGEEQIALDNFSRLQGSEEGNRFASEALFRLGDAYLEREEYRTAIGYYAEYLQKHPKHDSAATVALHKAGAEFELADHAAVVATVDAMDRGRASKREAFEADLLRARSLHRLRRSEDAAQALAKIASQAEEFEQRPATLILQAEIELARGNEEAGLSTLRALVEEFKDKPTESEARYTIANYYLERFGPGDGRLREELDAAAAGRGGGSSMEQVRDLRKRIVRYRELQDLLAIAQSDSARAAAPDSAALAAADSVSALHSLDLAELLLTELERPREALHHYRRALELGGADAPRAAYAIAYIFEQSLAKPDSARLARELLRERYPDSVQARSLDGELFLAARERTQEEIDAILAGDFRPTGPLGGDDFGTGSNDARGGRRRSLARGGPGATMPRELGPR